MIVLRSLVFNVVFYLVLAIMLVAGSWLLLPFAPRIWAIRALQLWARISLWLLRVICNITMEIRGSENIPRGKTLVAGKHQSFWETFAILPLLDDPCMVLKKSLTYIPFFGWFCIKFKMIAVERAAGAEALKDLVKRAHEEIARGRDIVIMPEGTRRMPGAEPDYKPGAAAVYAALGVTCVPFGLNSGIFWRRRSFRRYPGTIVLEFGKPIPHGLRRKVFQVRLQAEIEAISQKLLLEAKRTY